MTDRELLCVMAAIVHAGNDGAHSEQECADIALCLSKAVDHRLHPLMHPTPEANEKP